MKPDTTDLTSELAAALDMLFSLATDKRTRLPRGELYTAMALSGAREALAKATAAGFLGSQITHDPYCDGLRMPGTVWVGIGKYDGKPITLLHVTPGLFNASS